MSKRTNKSNLFKDMVNSEAASQQTIQTSYEIPSELGQTGTQEQRFASKVRAANGSRLIRLRSGQLIKLKTLYIAAEDVASLTFIHECNIRSADGVNLHTVQDIIEPIRKDGVLMEVLAIQMEDTRYAIIDGQRRRFCAIEVGCGLTVAYVSHEERIDLNDLREHSRVSNMAMVNSLYDKGCYYQRLCDENNWQPSEVTAIAEAASTTKQDVLYSLRAYQIPIEIYRLLPAGTSTGRPTVLKIASAISGLTDGQKVELVTWAASTEQYSSAPHCIAAMMQQIRLITGENGAERDKPILIGGIEVREKRAGRFEVKLPEGITAEQLYAALNALS